MGIGSDLIYDLTNLKNAGELVDSKRVVEIGAQQLSNSFLGAGSELTKLYKLFGKERDASADQAIRVQNIQHGVLEHQAADAPFARSFWTDLGFEYASIDIDGSPGSIPLDLNVDSIPRKHRGRFDLVTNFGTTEHVCNQLNAFKVIHDLTKLGGLMMHNLPAQGMMNHGLVNYNPKFFWMLARSNGYTLNYLTVQPSGEGYSMPENIRDNMQTTETTKPLVDVYRTEDVMIKVILKKVYDIEFVPPIDVPTGVSTDNKALHDRYWTVFEPQAFERISVLINKYRPEPSSFKSIVARLFRGRSSQSDQSS
jgi:hypothetical protein